jgi:hypothetical protein
VLVILLGPLSDMYMFWRMSKCVQAAAASAAATAAAAAAALNICRDI